MRCREIEFRRLGGYCPACLEADDIGMGEWRGGTGIKYKEDIACTCIDWTRSRRWSPHLKKTPMYDDEREKRKAVTAKRNKLEKKQKTDEKKLKTNQAEWIADFFDVEEDDGSDDDKEEEGDVDIMDDDEDPEEGEDDNDF